MSGKAAAFGGRMMSRSAIRCSSSSPPTSRGKSVRSQASRQRLRAGNAARKPPAVPVRAAAARELNGVAARVGDCQALAARPLFPEDSVNSPAQRMTEIVALQRELGRRRLHRRMPRSPPRCC